MWLGCAAAGVVGALAIVGDPVAVVVTPLCFGGLVLALAAIDWLLSHGAAIAIFWVPGAILAAAGIAFLLSLRRSRTRSNVK